MAPYSRITILYCRQRTQVIIPDAADRATHGAATDTAVGVPTRLCPPSHQTFTPISRPIQVATDNPITQGATTKAPSHTISQCSYRTTYSMPAVPFTFLMRPKQKPSMRGYWTSKPRQYGFRLPLLLVVGVVLWTLEDFRYLP